jgi:hypothetical protein
MLGLPGKLPPHWRRGAGEEVERFMKLLIDDARARSRQICFYFSGSLNFTPEVM